MKKIVFSLLSFLLFNCSCEKMASNPVVSPPVNTTPTTVVTTPPLATLNANFEENPSVFPIEPHIIDEASGLCESRSMPGNLWVEQDSGNPNELYLLSNQGKYKGKITLNGTKNRDWEDITIGEGPEMGKIYIYLADIGDNNADNHKSHIYRFVEPKNLQEEVSQIDKITYVYPDGSRDAETILLDPATKDIYIVSKRESKVRLYQLPFPQSITETITAKFITELPFTYITSGGISADGREIMLKDYYAVFYWQRKEKESIIEALSRPNDKKLPYIQEPQGEGICFDKDGKGYFTISEIYNAASVNLYYYARKK